MENIMAFSSLITSVQAWDGLAMRIVARFVLPYQRQGKLGEDVCGIIKDAPKLDFVPLGKYPKDKIPWDDESKPEPHDIMVQRPVAKCFSSPFLGLVLAFSSLVIWTGYGQMWKWLIISAAETS